MAILVTGGTGFIGAYVVSGLLEEHDERVALLVRAECVEEAEKKLWRSLQLHLDFATFLQFLRTRIDIYLGDLTLPQLGLGAEQRERLIHCTESVIHLAAALNRRSDKVCLNVNLRGTLEVIKLARAAHDHHGLRRFSNVSTSAVCGERQGELVTEADCIDWRRRDYDPYGRTKKFCEHMVRELLPEVPVTVFRPSTVLGDSRFPETVESQMVKAFVVLAHLPVLPFSPDARHDIVSADYVGRAIVSIHQRPQPRYDIYHLSSGSASLTYRQMMEAMRRDGHRVPHLFAPRLQRVAARAVELASSTPRRWGLSAASTLLEMFWPYLVFDTVFDNTRVVEEMGEPPVPFSEYAYDLMQFALSNRFSYPYQPWPEGPGVSSETVQ